MSEHPKRANIKIQPHYIELIAPSSLLEWLSKHSYLTADHKNLVIICGQLGDFDSIEYAQALVPALDRIRQAKFNVILIGIGDCFGADRFCAYTGFPRELVVVEPNNQLHCDCGLYEGLKTGLDPWFNLLMMCAGIGSQGTLKEVLRGYIGDRNAKSRIHNSLFNLVGRDGYLRPFELATVRLQNMIEVLSNWKTYVPNHQWLCQRGGTFILNSENDVMYSYFDVGILGFSETMAEPLSFLNDYL